MKKTSKFLEVIFKILLIFCFYLLLLGQYILEEIMLFVFYCSS